MFLQKVHVETFFKQIDKNVDASFSSTICFIAFLGVSQRWEFKSTTKNILQNKSCRKVFTKKSTKNPKPIFSRFFFITFLGRFSVRGVRKNTIKKNLNLVLFWPLTHPPTTGVTDFGFFAASCAQTDALARGRPKQIRRPPCEFAESRPRPTPSPSRLFFSCFFFSSKRSLT
jgi:hypothetical protein